MWQSHRIKSGGMAARKKQLHFAAKVTRAHRTKDKRIRYDQSWQELLRRGAVKVRGPISGPIIHGYVDKNFDILQKNRRSQKKN